MKKYKPFISSKPYKQWCKARGINFKKHIAKYPEVARRLNMKTLKQILNKQ